MDNLSREIKAVVPVADGATVTLPCDRGERFSVTLAGTGRTVALSGDSDGQRIELTVTQDGTGSRTITTWPATVNWRNGAAPTLRTAAGAVDVVVLVRVSSGVYIGYHDAASATAATPTATTVEVDLGAAATFRGKFTVTDAAISAASKVLCWQSPGPYTGKGTRADEAEAQPVQVVSVEPGSGSAVVRWQTPPAYATVPVVGSGSRSPAVSNNELPLIPAQELRRVGLVRGNVKFTYTILA